MAKGSDAARELARRRWDNVSAEDRSKLASELATKRWGDMTAEERSKEMRRRRLKGLKGTKAKTRRRARS